MSKFACLAGLANILHIMYLTLPMTAKKLAMSVKIFERAISIKALAAVVIFSRRDAK